MRVVCQLSTLVTCISASPALRTGVRKAWEAPSPAGPFTSEALKLEGMETFLRPKILLSFLPSLGDLSYSFSPHHSKFLKMAPVGKHQGPDAPSGELSQDPRVTPGPAAPSATGHSPAGSEHGGQSRVPIRQPWVPQARNPVTNHRVYPRSPSRREATYSVGQGWRSGADGQLQGGRPGWGWSGH